jgi:hypothetical protein
MTLLATKGIHPREFQDFGEDDDVTFALRQGFLDDFKPVIRDVKARLRNDFFSPEYVEKIIHGVRVTDSQAYAFAQVHAAICIGEIWTGGIVMNAPPPIPVQIRPGLLDGAVTGDLRLTIATPRDVTEGASRDTRLEVNGSMPMRSAIPCQDPECRADHEMEHGENSKPETVSNPVFVLDIGYTSATRTFGYLKAGVALARWMAGSPYLHFLLPTATFTTRFGHGMTGPTSL